MPDSPFDLIPDAETIRVRLAVVATEANLLRRQLRLSTKKERETERLRRLVESRKTEVDRVAS